MRIFATGLLLLLAASFASAQRKPIAAETPAAFALRVEKAFESKRLASLDGAKPSAVKVVIEHSLGEGRDARESRSFRSLKSAEAWMKKTMIAGAGFHGGKFDGCRRGRCGFSRPYGILHNNLYLVDFTYGVASGKYFIKTISLLDGD